MSDNNDEDAGGLRSMAIDPPPRAGGDEETGFVIYVSGITRTVTQEDLENIFSSEKHGKPSRIQLVADPHTKENRGFAFITYEHPEAGEAVLNELVDVELKGVRLRLEKARRTKPRSPTPGRFYGSRDGRRTGRDYGRDRDYRRRSPSRRDRSPMRIVDSYVGSGQRRDRGERGDRRDDRRDRDRDDRRNDRRDRDYRSDDRYRQDDRYRPSAAPVATGAIYYPPPATAVGYTSAYDLGRNGYGQASRSPPRY